MLTRQQKQHFETFGFLKLTVTFSPQETSEITRLFDEVMMEGRYGQPYGGTQRLGNIRTPAMVTVGSFDVAVPPIYGREAADAIPGAESVVFEDGGHLHNTEQPDEFNAVALDFLHRHAA
ncbi:MAG: hypothetical protein O3A47_09670 [Chloroflexi bacterium]|nr:hypothetical protein [Chloroflexota bacterium]